MDAEELKRRIEEGHAWEARTTKILFWRPLGSRVYATPEEWRLPRVENHVQEELDPERVKRIVEFLTHPEFEMGYRGDARCRICKKMLGYRDFFRGKWCWPEMAEHYILEHNVWVPELDEILDGSEEEEG